MSRASSWLIGVCLGGALACAWYLGHAVFGWPWGWQIGASLVLMLAGATPAFEWFVSLALSARAGWLHPEQAFVGATAEGVATDDDQAGDDNAPGPGDSARSVSPLVGGGLLSAWEQYHYDGLLTLLDHAEAADSLTSTALIPAAFVDGKHWGYWTGILAASHICNKANGVETKLPQGRTFAWAKRQIKNGDFEAPEDLGAAPPAPPHPYREGLDYHVKVKLEKADKAGQKVARDDDD